MRFLRLQEERQKAEEAAKRKSDPSSYGGSGYSSSPGARGSKGTGDKDAGPTAGTKAGGQAGGTNASSTAGTKAGARRDTEQSQAFPEQTSSVVKLPPI